MIAQMDRDPRNIWREMTPRGKKCLPGRLGIYSIVK
jgi:hypothetical protein